MCNSTFAWDNYDVVGLDRCYVKEGSHMVLTPLRHVHGSLGDPCLLH